MTIEIYKRCLLDKFDDLSLNSTVNKEFSASCELGECDATLRLCTDGLTDVLGGACSELNRNKQSHARVTPRLGQENPIFNSSLSPKML